MGITINRIISCVLGDETILQYIDIRISVFTSAIRYALGNTDYFTVVFEQFSRKGLTVIKFQGINFWGNSKIHENSEIYCPPTIYTYDMLHHLYGICYISFSPDTTAYTIAKKIHDKNDKACLLMVRCVHVCVCICSHH